MTAMNFVRQGRLSPVILLVLIGLTGCSGGGSGMTGPANRAMRITPADGTTAVRLDAPIVLDFGVPVSRAVVENNIHLISEPDMYASCPDSTMGAHGPMNAVMQDPAMLEHMSQFHATRGRFAWNDAGSICTLQPDSLMRADTRYMVHLGGDMMRGMQQMGVTMPAGEINQAADMMIHFQTMGAAGHAGHH